MDIVLIMAFSLFVMLIVSWLVLPHSKELSEAKLEFAESKLDFMGDERQFAKAS
ncbi:MAG: hypothetical protein HXX20_20405 [Chloroflexi bacterium]|nr:hypothetical protein [Chloroflexota bacterium]